MDNYEIIRPYQHEVYSAKIGHFDIEIDIEFENGLSTVILSSKIGDVVFYYDKLQRHWSYEEASNFYINDGLINSMVALSNWRLDDIKQLTKG